MDIRRFHGGNDRECVLAARPPLEVLKLVLSIITCNQCPSCTQPHIIDISKGNLQANATSLDLCAEIPTEMQMFDCCGHLKEALCGTRDGAKCWEKDYSATLEAQGYKSGRTHPCLFRHVASGSVAFVHGDDSPVSGPDAHLKKLRAAVGQRYATKVWALSGQARTTTRRCSSWGASWVGCPAGSTTRPTPGTPR